MVKKRILAAIAAIVILLPLIPVSASADLTCSCSYENTQVGQTFDLELNCHNTYGLEAASLEVYYDSNVIKVANISSEGFAGAFYSASIIRSGLVRVGVIYPTANTHLGVDVVRITFRLIDEAKTQINVVVTDWVGTEKPSGQTISLDFTPSSSYDTGDDESTTKALTTETPVTEVLTTKAPTTEALTTEPTITEASTTEVITTKAPVTEALTTEVLTTKASITEVLTTNASTTEALITEAPITEILTTESLTTVATITEALTTEPTITEALTGDTLTTKAPSTEAPITEALPTKAATTEEPSEAMPSQEESSVITPEYKKGDINGDGKITSIDARIILRISARLEKLEDYLNALLIADVNGDGKITAVDARKVLRVATRLDIL